MNLSNMPELKLGIVAVSRDCFPDVFICKQKKGSCGSIYRKSMMRRTFTNVLSVSWKAKSDMVQASEDIKRGRMQRTV